MSCVCVLYDLCLSTLYDTRAGFHYHLIQNTSNSSLNISYTFIINVESRISELLIHLHEHLLYLY